MSGPPARAGDPGPVEGAASRRLALEVLARVEDDDAYANLALSAALDRSGMPTQDRAMVTDLVYGTLRRQRAMDHLADRFLASAPPPAARRALRLGAYQLVERDDIPDYAAVDATVAASPKRFRGLVNAVLRKVAAAPVTYPDDATAWSYPDWIVQRLGEDLGGPAAEAALLTMNQPASATLREDGYVQDRASQLVAAAVGAQPGELVFDLCAAPGGKATALAAQGAVVVAADLQEHRVGLVRANAARLGATSVLAMVADARHPALRPGVADRVLLDAPCSGLGVLRRRPDARWRLRADVVARLAELQRELFDAAVGLVRPGGELVYSVCTLTRAEGPDLDHHVQATHPDLEAIPVPEGPWQPAARGAWLLPQAAGTDGMFLVRYRVPGPR